jgi:hypothetical protein
VGRSASWKVAVLLLLVAAASFALGYYAMQRFIL